MKLATIAVAFACVLTLPAHHEIHAQSVNVALGKPVTGVGDFGGNANRDGFVWPNPAPADFSTLTDGIVLPDGTQWQTGTVWWDLGETLDFGEEAFATRLEIDLGREFMLTGAGLSFDNNDEYDFFIRSSVLDPWTPWFFFNCVGCNSGLVFDQFPDEPALYQMARFVAVSGSAGDGFHSLSEIQVFAVVVPEPASAVLLLVGVGGLALGSRRRTVS